MHYSLEALIFWVYSPIKDLCAGLPLLSIGFRLGKILLTRNSLEKDKEILVGNNPFRIDLRGSCFLYSQVLSSTSVQQFES